MNELEQKFWDCFISYAKQKPIFCIFSDIVSGDVNSKIATCKLQVNKNEIYENEVIFKIPSSIYGIMPDFDFYDFNFSLIPQYEKGSYIIDFALISNICPYIELGIEIDGHEWHEKNKEQAAKDKRRDREVLFMNFPIARFTGSEIYTNPQKCISESINIFIALSFAFLETNPNFYMEEYEFRKKEY